MGNIKAKKADESLFRTKGFWYTLSIPIFIGLLLSLCIIVENDLEFSLKIQSLAFAMDVFEIPLLIASMSFPTVALVVYNHRSKQTKHQIENSNAQLIASLTPELIINDCYNGSVRVIKLINIGMATAKIESISYEMDGALLSEMQFYKQFPDSYDDEKVTLKLLDGIGYLCKDLDISFIEYEFKPSGLTNSNWLVIEELLEGTALIIKYTSMLESNEPFELRHSFNQ